MLNIVSLLIGLAALPMAVIAFIPFLGWANWMIIPIAGIGAVVGMLSGRSSGRTLNLIVLGIAVIRLMLGGGFI